MLDATQNESTEAKKPSVSPSKVRKAGSPLFFPARELIKYRNDPKRQETVLRGYKPDQQQLIRDLAKEMWKEDSAARIAESQSYKIRAKIIRAERDYRAADEALKAAFLRADAAFKAKIDAAMVINAAVQAGAKTEIESTASAICAAVRTSFKFHAPQLSKIFRSPTHD